MKYPVGTRHCDAVIYDEATDEVVEGFQVFRQCKPDGTPTGRKAILVGSRLMGLSLAKTMREEAVTEAAPAMLQALKDIVADLGPDHGLSVIALEAIERAEGIKE